MENGMKNHGLLLFFMAANREAENRKWLSDCYRLFSIDNIDFLPSIFPFSGRKL